MDRTNLWKVLSNHVVLLHFKVLHKLRLVRVSSLEKGEISDCLIFLEQIVIASPKVLVCLFQYLDFSEPFEFFDQ